MTRSDDRGLVPQLERGEVYLVHDGDDLVGTLTLDGYADPEFWTAEDQPDSALYVHRMIVARKASGRGIGGRMLEWASEQAAAQDRHWLRLDAWRTNTALHRYYESQGFTRTRTVELSHRGSGALFQRPAHAVGAPFGHSRDTRLR